MRIRMRMKELAWIQDELPRAFSSISSESRNRGWLQQVFVQTNGNVTFVADRCCIQIYEGLTQMGSFSFLITLSTTIYTWSNNSYFELNRKTLKALCSKFSDSIFSIRWPAYTIYTNYLCIINEVASSKLDLFTNSFKFSLHTLKTKGQDHLKATKEYEYAYILDSNLYVNFYQSRDFESIWYCKNEKRQFPARKKKNKNGQDQTKNWIDYRINSPNKGLTLLFEEEVDKSIHHHQNSNMRQNQFTQSSIKNRKVSLTIVLGIMPNYAIILVNQYASADR